MIFNTLFDLAINKERLKQILPHYFNFGRNILTEMLDLEDDEEINPFLIADELESKLIFYDSEIECFLILAYLLEKQAGLKTIAEAKKIVEEIKSSKPINL